MMRLITLVLLLAAVAASAAAQEKRPAADPPAPGAPVVRKMFGHDMIFANAQAADLAAKGMACDRNYSPNGDYRKAVEFYAQAIAAQPGAKINAFLANRLAQIHAYTEDRAAGWRTDRAKGAEWWRRCIEASSPKQLIWAQAHIGIACSQTIEHDRPSAVEELEAVFEVDPVQVELPEWEHWPEPKSEREKAQRQMELDRERKRMEEAQRAALDTLLYITKGMGRAKAAEIMWGVAQRHAGTPAGDYARMLAGREFPGMEPPEPPAPPVSVREASVAPKPPADPPKPKPEAPSAPAPVPAPLADASTSPDRAPLWLLVPFVALVALILVAGVRAILRRREV